MNEETLFLPMVLMTGIILCKLILEQQRENKQQSND